jgi:hypothetical protein
MHQERIMHASIFDIFTDHEIGRELKSMSGRREIIERRLRFGTAKASSGWSRHQ